MPMTSLADLKAELDNIETKITEVLTTGQSYSINGSHTITNTALPGLYRQAALLKRRIFRYQGYISRTIPNFSQNAESEIVTMPS